MSSQNQSIGLQGSLGHAIGLLAVGGTFGGLVFFNAYPREALYALAFFSSISVFLNPLLGLTLAVASLPWFGFARIGDGLSLTKGLTALTAVALMLRLGLGAWTMPRIPKSLRWYAFALGFSVTTSLFTPGFNDLFLDAIKTPILSLFFSFLFLAIMRDYDELRFMSLGGILGATALVVGILILGIETFVGSSVREMRLAVGTDENELGNVLTMCLALCLIVGTLASTTLRVMVAVSGVMILYAILLTQSRGTWVGILFATLVTTFFVPGLSLKQRVTFVGGFLFVGLLAIFLVVHDVGGVGAFVEARTVDFFQKGTAGSVGRVEWIWPLWINVFLENPLIGLGIGSHFTVLNVGPHNNVLNLLGERGLLGFSVHGIFVAFIYRESLRNANLSFRCIAIWILLFIGMAGMFIANLNSPAYAMGIGLVAVLNSMGAKSLP